MSKGRAFAQRLVRGVERFKPDTSLLASLQETGIRNETIRNHPCHFQLPCIRLPERLDRAAIEVLKDVNVSPKDLQKMTTKLVNKLWSRALPIEGEQRRSLYSKYKAQIEQDEEMRDGMTAYDKKELKRKVDAEILNWQPLSYSVDLAPVYLVGKLAPNFATNCRVLYEIRKRCPSFQPSSLFDFGSGLGTVTWAANSVWQSGCIREHFLVDTSSAMIRLSEKLFRDGRYSDQIPACFPNTYVRQFLPASPEPKFDLVVASGSLIDIGMSASRKTVLRTLWEKTAKFLVLVEAGNTAGFQAILEARNFILQEYGGESVEDPEQRAQIFSPCPHQYKCPKAASICNFNVKYKQFNLLTSKESHLNEMFSYIILCRGEIPVNDEDKLTRPRIVSFKARKTPKFVVHDVCNEEGSIDRVVFAKRTTDKFLYAMVSRCKAGDRLPAEIVSEEQSTVEKNEED